MNGENNNRSGSFLFFFERVISQLKEGKQVNTWKKYSTSLKKLKIYWGNRDFKFEEFTSAFLVEYESFMKSQNKKVNTINKELKVLRAVLYRAIKEDAATFPKNPFFGFQLKTGKTNKSKLDKLDIESIEKLELNENSSLFHTKNYFLFSFYCSGIRFADLTELKWENVLNGRLSYKMGKTEEYKSILLHNKPLKILEYYEMMKRTEHGYIFPILGSKEIKDPFKLKNKISSKNSRINKELKELASL